VALVCLFIIIILLLRGMSLVLFFLRVAGFLLNMS
jgi:hypothetical protein